MTIWASNEPRICSWSELEGLKWIPKGQGVKHLGVQIRFGFSRDASFDNLLASFKTKLITWAFAKLSLARRALVAN
jgi:hypothetical protein